METKDICVFVPSYNAAKTLSGVIARIPEDLWIRIDKIFIINDGSSDETAAIGARLAEEDPRIEVHSLPQNQGYGGAVRKGLQLSRERNPEFVVCLHSDGQYPPESALEFIDHMQQHKISVLQGSRHKGGTALEGGMPVYKVIAGKILTFLSNTILGMKMTDYFSGFLIYDAKALHSLPINELSYYFEYDFEVIVCCRAGGIAVSELAIPTHYGDEESHLDPIQYGFRVLYVLGRYITGHYKRLMA